MDFESCYVLTSVTIPDIVTSIGEGVFTECSSRTSIVTENPDCEIYDSSRTINNGYIDGDPNFNGTIYGYEDSTAQAYAEKYGYTFESLGAAPEFTPTYTAM